MRPNDDDMPIREKNLLERCIETKSRSHVNEKEYLTLLGGVCENIAFDFLQHSYEASMNEDSGVKINGDVIKGTVV